MASGCKKTAQQTTKYEIKNPSLLFDANKNLWSSWTWIWASKFVKARKYSLKKNRPSFYSLLTGILRNEWKWKNQTQNRLN